MQNVSLNVKFQSQFSPRVGDVDGDGDVDKKDQMIGCNKACKLMIQDAGFIPVSAHKRLDIATYDRSENLVSTGKEQEGITLIDQMLDSGMPVLVGVNRGRKRVNNSNKSTNHFVLIVARLIENGVKSYLHYDPGTTHKEKGTSPLNKFTVNADLSITGKTAYREEYTYRITEVRPTLKKG